MINLNEISGMVERKADLFTRIKMHRNNMRLLLDFATGYKHKKGKFYRSNDWRLISTIKNLHIQSRELQKEYKLLNQLIRKGKKL